MRNVLAIAAASAPLMLSAVGALADEPSFQTPKTDRALQTQALLRSAAHALNDTTCHDARHGEHISSLWLFPTADQQTVFAHYIVTRNAGSSAKTVSKEHLELLTLKDDRVVAVRDLTRASIAAKADE
ncbi:MAG TPA: hypothetical protein VKB41_13055 [Steroidobacteraceae bacterium]|nr:hypothetical protein [Steroidobacteraceae bacterium]